MFEFLLYANISCINAAEMLDRIRENENISDHIKVELIETIQEATPHCDWDAQV